MLQLVGTADGDAIPRREHIIHAPGLAGVGIGIVAVLDGSQLLTQEQSHD